NDLIGCGATRDAIRLNKGVGTFGNCAAMAPSQLLASAGRSGTPMSDDFHWTGCLNNSEPNVYRYINSGSNTMLATSDPFTPIPPMANTTIDASANSAVNLATSRSTA